MGSLFRGEEMVLCQLFLQNEATYSCVSHLGELGLVQFRDSNAAVSAFQRKFVNQVRRCEEMQRKLCYFQKEIRKLDIPEDEVEGNPLAPQPKELIDLEAAFEKNETELKQVNTNAVTLKQTYLELIELKQILLRAKTFFYDEETSHQLDSIDTQLVGNEVPSSSTPVQLGFVTGVILRERLPAFETMLWRACHGNVYLKQADIDQNLEDPVTGDSVQKVVFIIFFQGERLKSRVKKICDGFRATLYPCPETTEERESMLIGVKTRIEDIHQILNQTTDHQYRLLVSMAKNIKTWFVKVGKVKAIYHTMNMFNQDVTKECLIAEGWCATNNLSWVQQALSLATEESGSSVPSILNRIYTQEQAPTYNVVNKFTTGFQSIVDAYGVGTYSEVNPAPFVIITFPFLFAVMFGDWGHGLIMALFALWMVLTEKKWLAEKSDNEMWTMIFAGRYIILLMGVFSIYTGLIYNDIFSKSINIFGSAWTIPHDVNYTYTNLKTVQLNPNGTYSGVPYPFGIDPIWQTAENKIVFLNSYKMKLSIIFGVSQMLFGVCLSLFNHVHFRRPLNIVFEFLPQVVFLLSVFGYLIAMILVKWFKYSSEGSYCIPSLLISLINMFMFSYGGKECNLQPMYDGQQQVQTALVVIAALCIPWMLFFKPIIKHNLQNKFPVTTQPDEHEGGQTELRELFINQAIHTIEYILGTVSHTASYLRLWALSLAHMELTEVLWSMVMKFAVGVNNYSGAFMLYFIFAFWAVLTVFILLVMEGLSAFLHALRLHWVEFQNKFYDGQGYAFCPLSFRAILDNEDEV